MGLNNRMRNPAGSVAPELLHNGQLGGGVIVSIQQTSVSTGADCDPSHVCVFTVEVALDDEPRYTATCRQAVRATLLPKLMMPSAIVAVRVDPDDRSTIALSLDEQPPTLFHHTTNNTNASPQGVQQWF